MQPANGFDPKFALNVMLPLAESAYLDFDQFGDSVEATGPLALPLGWTLVARLQPGNFGFVAKADGQIAIAFRGTQTKGEWLEDFDGLMVGNTVGQGHVHQGFLGQYVKIRRSLIDAILPFYVSGNPQFWITGHSLGAALAVLCQADIGAPLAYTWAGPRVGDHEFAQWFASLGLSGYRIVNEWDVVPQLPPLLNGYEHVGTEILVNGGRHPLADFVKDSHNLELSYRPGVERLLAAIPQAA